MVELAKPFTFVKRNEDFEFYRIEDIAAEREAWQKEIAKWEAYTNDLEEEYAIEGAVTIQDKKAIRRRYGL